MGPGAKPAKANLATRASVARTSRKSDSGAVTQLEKRLADALEQQTATSEILRVISCSPTDVQPVFDAIAVAALELCRATLANVFKYDGELIHLVAVRNANINPEYFAAIQSAFPRSPGLDSAAGRAVLTRNIVAIPDVSKDPDYAIGTVTLGEVSKVCSLRRSCANNVRSVLLWFVALKLGRFPNRKSRFLRLLRIKL